MKPHILAILALAASLLNPVFGEPFATPGIRQVQQAVAGSEDFSRLPVSWQVSEEDRQTAAKAWDLILQARKDRPESRSKLYVVYVSFRNREAFPEFRERYDRILKNIQAYFSDQMQACGYPPLTFPLELDNQGKLVVHEAYVDVPMEDLSRSISRNLSREAALKALAAKGIDAKSNHVLVVCQLDDGVGPYYGAGTSRSGMAWTCDQEGLDPRDLSNKLFYGGRYQLSIGGNATTYIGGTAFELGLAFGLTQTLEGWDYPEAGKSLMSRGNHAYGNELRQEGRGAFLSPVSALYLLPVGLFNGVEPWTDAKYTNEGIYSDVSFEPVPHGARISGTIRSPERCYAVVVGLDPPGHNAFDTNAKAVVPDENGRFSVEIRRPDYTGYLTLKVSSLYVDGTRKLMPAPAYLSEKGLEAPAFVERTYFSRVLEPWSDRKYEEARAALAELVAQHGDNSIVKKALPLWERALSEREPELRYAPAEAPDDVRELSLVDCRYVEAKVGWGVPCWDMLLPSDMGPQAYLIDGGAVERFMMIHAVGLVSYDLGGKWNRLRAQLGVHWGKDGSVRFEVFGDGKLLHTTQTQYEGESERIDLDVTGIKKLEIRVGDAGNGAGADWAVIGNPVLTR